MKKIFPILLIVFACNISNAQTWNWAKKYGVTNYDIAVDVTTDYDDGVYIVGRSSYGIEFDTDTLLLPCNHLAKLDTLGNEQWVKIIPNPNFGDTWTQVAVDSDDNVYILDKLSADTLVVDQDTVYSADGKFYISKFDTHGNQIWTKAICKTTSTFGNYLRIGDLDISPNDELHLSGSFADTAVFDQDTLFEPDGRAFVARYDSDGNQLMVAQYGSWHQNVLTDGYGIAADDQGCTYVSGRISLGGIFGGDTVWCQQSVSEMYIMKFSPTGDVLWYDHTTGVNIGTGGIADEICSFGLDWDHNGNVIIAGYFNTENYFGDSTLLHPYSKAYWSSFVAKYDTTGNFKWVKHEDLFYFLGVECDLAGNIYLSGLYRDSINYWGTNFQAPSLNLDGIVSRLDSSGNVDWVLTTEGRLVWDAIATAKCSSNKTYLAGQYSQFSLPLGGINLPAPTQNDMFIASIENNNPGNDCIGIGFKENQLEESLLIYPNPGSDQIFISYKGKVDELKIYDLSGTLVFEENSSQSNLYTLNVADFPRGMYVIQILSGDELISRRIIRQ